MQLYQQEYIANLKEIVMLTMGERREKLSFEAYLEQSDRKRRRGEELVKRNMKLLREGLFPVLDHIYAADETEISELREFAGELTGGKEDLDGGIILPDSQGIAEPGQDEEGSEGDDPGIVLPWYGILRFVQ